MIASNHYDELGSLSPKGVGNTAERPLQRVDYSYNVRGWLTGINDTQAMGDDLFAFGMNYNTPEYGGAALYNGNIAETKWKTASADTSLKNYRYSYDANNRITSAIDNTSKYNVTGISYDKNGNIQKLKREGRTIENPSLVNNTGFGTMDDLNYFYDTGNKLIKVTDNGSTGYGFVDGVNSSIEYEYDGNGNMTSDANKGITSITYNHLNLPVSISTNSGTISYIYDATGVKLEKSVSLGNSVTEYAGDFVYQDGTLQFFGHPEGYVTTDEVSGYDYVYQYKDHLGNIRLSFKDNNGDLEIVEENNYYPFGLEHKGYNNVVNGQENNYQTYQGVELSESLGYNMLEFDLRHYDPAIGRFVTTDPYEQFQSPYLAMGNNPIVSFDPDGGKCYDVNGNEVACPDGEEYDEYRDSDKSHLTVLDEVEVNSSESNNQSSVTSIYATHRFPAVTQLSGLVHFIAEVAVNVQGYRVEQGPGGNYHVDDQGNVIFGPYQGGLGAVGIIGGFYNPKNLIKVAKLLDKGGLTKIGRALQKHGSRPGSRFPQAVGNPASINAQGEKILSNILSNPGSKVTVRHTGRFGDVLEVVSPNGQGARFSKDGKEFLGLINR